MASTDSVPLAAPAKENVVNPIPPLALALLSICLLVWVISLFLPAATTMTWNGEQSSKGSDLAIASAIFFWVPVFGWASLANVFMLISPFEIKRVRRGKGRVFACLFLVFAVIPMAIAFPVRGMLNPGEVRTLETGFYVWQASLLVQPLGSCGRCGANRTCGWLERSCSACSPMRRLIRIGSGFAKS